MKKKITKTDLLIIIVLIIIICASYIAFTSAKYKTGLTNSDTAYVAKWSFVDGDSSTNLMLTADETQYPNLKPGTIAPGSSGEFNIVLDATGSDVGAKYKVAITPVENNPLPTGLTIAASSLEGTILFDSNSENMKKTIKVTWEWTYGDNIDQNNYDENLDTGYNNDESGKTYLVNVAIHGEQLQPTE